MAVQRARSTYTDNITQLTHVMPSSGFGLPSLPGAETLFATAAQGQREMMDFVVRRLEKDRETIQEASACRTWGDALALQSRWMQEMVRDYTDQTSKMMTLYGARVSSNANARANKEAEE